MRTDGDGATWGSGDGFHNEDAFLVEEGLGLYVVCDGFSGGPGGEVASATAISALEAFVERQQKISGTSLLRTFSSYRVAGQAVRCALRAVVEVSSSRPELEGMATTLSMLLVHGHRGAISHVGDSRVYLYRDHQVHLLTHDHDLTGSLELAAAPGAEEEAIDTFSIDLRFGDIFLLCTDGAEDVVEDPEVLHNASEISPRALASRIVTAAHKLHPECDATVVVVRVREDDEPAWLWLSKRPESFDYGHAVAYA